MALSTNQPSSRQKWLQQSILRRLVTPVKNSVSDIIEHDAPFLQTAALPCAVLARHEIQINTIPVGTGGFSTVHEIVDLELDENVTERCNEEQRLLRNLMRAQLYDENGTPRFVLKHLKKQLLETPKSYQCALRDLVLEVEYMNRFSHENILPLVGRPIDGIDACQDSYDGFFLITERLETTLSYRIKEWNVTEIPPTLEERLPYMEQLGKALAYLHERRIVFRDLKPDNVGISGKSIKLFDFGLCRQLPEDHSLELYEMSGVGTQRYMASEILEGTTGYNCKVDVYGWALLSWEILTGVRPYMRYGNKGHRAAVVFKNERPPLPSHWPVPLQSILHQSWCRTIQDRYTMSQALTELAAGRRVARRRPTICVKAPTLSEENVALIHQRRTSQSKTLRAIPQFHQGCPAAA